MVRTAVRVAAGCIAFTTACHVTQRVPDLRAGETRYVPATDRMRELPPTLVVTDDGRFRFVVPQVCPTTESVDMQSSTIIHVRPNLATFVVGTILGSLGAVGTGIAIGQGDPSAHPVSYVAPVALGVGLVLAIGPFVGTGDDREYGGVKKIERPGKDAPCGERGYAAQRANLMWHGLRAVGTVDGDGVFSVSPYELVDAFAAGRGPALDLTADVELAGVHVPIQVVIAGDALVKGRDAYFKRTGIDGRWEQLRKVPRVEPGAVRVSRTTVAGHAVLRIALPLENNGPGDAWQVRGLINAQDAEVDGRVIYVGHIAAHGKALATADVPLSPEADRALAGDTIELGVTLIDADATTSSEPVRFRGTVLNDVPR